MEQEDSRLQPLLTTFNSFQDSNESTISSVFGYYLTPDQALREVNNKRGFFQVFIALVSALTFATLGHISYALPYLQAASSLPPIICKNQEESQFVCSQATACSDPSIISYSFDQNLPPHSFLNWINDFGLLCDQYDGSISWLGTAYFLGYLISSIVFLRLADIVGRKPIILAGLGLQMIIILSVLFSRSSIILYCFQFFLGIRGPMASQIVSIHSIELSDPSLRSYMTMAIVALDGFTGVWLPFLFYFLQSWKYLFFGNLAIVILCFIIYCVCIPESPRYFISRHKYPQARKAYAKIAEWNKRQMFSEPLKGEPITMTLYDSPPNSYSRIQIKLEPHSLSQLWKKNKHFRKLIILIPLLGIIAQFSFYGILYGLNHLNGSIFINGAAIGAADVTAGLAIGPLTNLMGRKRWIKLSWVLTGVACVTYPFVTSSFKYILLWIGKFGATSCFGTLFLIAAQVFPTEFRGTMTGVLKATASIGGVIAPLISGFLRDKFMFIIGALGVCGYLLSFLLVQTHYLRMTDDLNERYKLYKRF